MSSWPVWFVKVFTGIKSCRSVEVMLRDRPIATPGNLKIQAAPRLIQVRGLALSLRGKIRKNNWTNFSRFDFFWAWRNRFDCPTPRNKPFWIN